ncbi:MULTISPECIES: Rieske (2Fe-2S) protein [Marinobacter]|uniref:Rieske 2Fe-2S domain-containing protein n=1 Tax=Marinobacter suaedae TaxID=3057675 RepID=A0ABT8W0N4_9GAMM|nr:MULTISPECIES: Rieske 2Fe-2S domain-containing protein [unclassified Marinobacter]MBZ2170406.1 Rieske 2Fe-2S domain-containing protein [Marinobacter sp. F4216]MDO3721804.1 Rieske 2Fe-2S domain-containing protein [Marinobacter sp. chi1]
MSTPSTPDWQTVCDLNDLQPGQFLEFRIQQPIRDPGDMPLTGFAFLEGDEPLAYLNQCPHLGVELNWMPGRFMDSGNLFIQCATHGALFKPGTGECITGPCMGEYLIPLDVRIESGEIQIRAPR